MCISKQAYWIARYSKQSLEPNFMDLYDKHKQKHDLHACNLFWVKASSVWQTPSQTIGKINDCTTITKNVLYSFFRQ